MSILLTGASGQVGWELRRTLSPLGEVFAADRRLLDLADRDAIVRVTRALKPRLIVNPAAFTAVDLAESRPQAATAVNAVAPGILAKEARRIGAGLIHFSTDHVFDGAKPGAYDETDAPNPLNVYGRTKLAGERAVAAAGGAHVILRTSWVYSTRGRNFLPSLLKLAAERTELPVVSDQHGSPTWARTVAEATAHIARAFLARRADWPSGTYHLACAGETTWFGFAQAILGQSAVLRAIGSADLPGTAPRPKNSRLSCRKLETTFGLTLPAWPSALAACQKNGVRPSENGERP